MKTSPVSDLLRAGVIAVCSCMAASTALAAPPNKERRTENIVGIPVGDCGTFEIWTDFVAEGFVIEHFDKDGNLAYVTEHWNYTESIYYNSEEPDIFISGGPGENDHWRFDFTSDSPTLAISGLTFKVTVPGHGVIFHEAGRTIYDWLTGDIIFQVGPSDFTDQDVAALCLALTP